ncbi:MAG: DUF4129 domain-containing protein [Candidatus Thermoplasmatota archaeon]
MALLMIILFSSLAVHTVSSNPENPDEAEEDISPLFESLNVTADKMELSLNAALNVNYTILENENKSLNYDYREEPLNKSERIASELEEELSKPASVFAEIEGEIESDEFLKEYNVPFHEISIQLIEYSKRHRYLVSNLSTMLIEYKSGEDDIGRAFKATHVHLNAMEDKLRKINATVQDKKGDNINLTGLERSIQNNELFLEDYTDMLGYIGKKLDAPPDLFIYGPGEVHPNEEFEIEVNFFDGTGFNTSADVSLFIDGNETDLEYRIERNSYIFSYQVNWTFEELNFSAQIERTEKTNITSDEITVEVVPYTSSIELETDKEVYYNETVTVYGEFQTEANIDLTKLDLDAPDKKISPKANGSFVLEYESKRFRWGLSEINVNYESKKNEPILSSSGDTTFEVSIPTDIIIIDYSDKVRYDDLNNFTLKGRLVNISEGQDEVNGLSSQELKVYLDGELITENRTDERGYFTFSLTTDKELEPGKHLLRLSFEGPPKYRSVDNSETQFDVIEDESQAEKFWNNPILMIGVGIAVSLILALVYFTGRKEEDKDMEELTKGDDENSISEISIPSASGKDDLTNSYRSFLETMEKLGFIEIQKGKTHREVEDEINSQLSVDELKREVRLVTDLFEKALFTDRQIKESEIEEFNSSLSKLGRRVLS